ncbi:DUF3300 domain-containing protein [Desulfocastanea catecholica]
MKKRSIQEKCSSALVFVLMIMLVIPPGAFGQQAEQNVFKQEELDQILAPIALYPDSLLTQILMASTYPLEIVQADRWAKENKDLTGDTLAEALEAQPWDPSVKSLINFPQVLDMMNEKVDWTQKLGDAFLAQQKDVMATVQSLRRKAEAEGNLKTTKEQTVVVEKETIIIQPANPQVVYVPTYNPTVVYGAWAYPSYPPYYYYPPGYAAGAGFAFATGVAIGAAWGYAWGHANWHGGDVDIDINRNTNINNNINRDKYKAQYQGKGQGGQGTWQHDASHRGGVSYRDQGTAQKYNRGTGSEAAKSREAFRGKAEAGRQDLKHGDADQYRGQNKGQRDASGRDVSTRDAGSRNASSRDAGSRNVSTRDTGSRNVSSRDAGTRNMSTRDSSGQRSSAYSGMDSSRATKDYSSRGSSSRQYGGSSGGGGRGGGGGGGGRR